MKAYAWETLKNSASVSHNWKTLDISAERGAVFLATVPPSNNRDTDVEPPAKTCRSGSFVRDEPFMQNNVVAHKIRGLNQGQSAHSSPRHVSGVELNNHEALFGEFILF